MAVFPWPASDRARRGQRRVQTRQMTVTTTEVLIVPYAPGCLATLIKSGGPNAVFIGNKGDDHVHDGYAITSGDALVLFDAVELYGQTSSATCGLYIMQLFDS